MERVLVFKTSSDYVFENLLDNLSDSKKKIECLVPSSKLVKYQEKYVYMRFIDIKKEGFYDLSKEIIEYLCQKEYEEIYITFSGVTGHNYGNVMDVVSKLKYHKGYFYNCNGNRVEFNKSNMLIDFLCNCYIGLMRKIY